MDVAILLLHCAARQTNPNAMEITGLTVDATVGLYDPDGDDDPETGAECSDTRPLVVALGSSAALTFANCVNFNAIKNARPNQVCHHRCCCCCQQCHCTCCWTPKKTP